MKKILYEFSNQIENELNNALSSPLKWELRNLFRQGLYDELNIQLNKIYEKDKK